MQRTRLMSVFLSLLALGLVSSCALSRITGGPVPAQRLADGVYRGSAWNGPVRAVVDVTVRDQRIADVALVSHQRWRGREAEDRIPGSIVAQQSTRVDAVTGATISSIAIMNAAQDAIEQAMD